MPSINLNLVVKKFLKKHANPEIPVLLGLSGGPDSLVLFHLLLEMQVKMGIAHVDHGWRKESLEEAKQLELLAAKYNIPFHLNTLDPKCAKGNLEDFCRNERLLFFRRLTLEHGYQAVLLGHHADDQAETVLKRLFEGANLTALSGLTPTICIESLHVWRPFLDLRKKNILDWLNQKNLKAFDDKTNADPKFLRARMRISLIPNLSHEFGKEISAPLVKLAQESLELREFLEVCLKPYMQRIERASSGLTLDLSKEHPPTLFEMKHLVRTFCQLEQVTLSRQQVETAAELLLSNAANKKLLNGGREIYIHLRCITLKK